MEIVLGKSAVRQIRLSAQDAIEEGDTETLREDILEAFTEEQVEGDRAPARQRGLLRVPDRDARRVAGDDVDELFELLDAQLGDIGVDVKFERKPVAAADDAEEEAEDETEDLDEDDEDLDEDDEDLDEDEEEDHRRRAVGSRCRRPHSSHSASRYAWHVAGALLFALRVIDGHCCVAHGT